MNSNGDGLLIPQHAGGSGKLASSYAAAICANCQTPQIITGITCQISGFGLWETEFHIVNNNPPDPVDTHKKITLDFSVLNGTYTAELVTFDEQGNYIPAPAEEHAKIAAVAAGDVCSLDRVPQAYWSFPVLDIPVPRVKTWSQPSTNDSSQTVSGSLTTPVNVRFGPPYGLTGINFHHGFYTPANGFICPNGVSTIIPTEQILAAEKYAWPHWGEPPDVCGDGEGEGVSVYPHRNLRQNWGVWFHANYQGFGLWTIGPSTPSQGENMTRGHVGIWGCPHFIEPTCTRELTIQVNRKTHPNQTTQDPPFVRADLPEHYTAQLVDHPCDNPPRDFSYEYINSGISATNILTVDYVPIGC